MKTEELKKEIINKIETISDKEKLETFLKFLNFETEDQNVYHLSKEEQEGIEIAREQIKKGNYLTQEEVDWKFRKWLEK